MDTPSPNRPGHRSRGSPPSLRSRLYLLILFTLLPAFALVIYDDFEERRLAIVEARAENREFARVVAAKEESLIEITRLLLISLSQNADDPSAQKNGCNELFEAMLKRYPQYANAGVIAPDGRVSCSVRPVESWSGIREDSWFKSAIRSGDFSIGEYEFVEHAKNAVLVFALPKKSADGRVNAVLFATLDLGWLNRLISQSDLPPGSHVSIIDRDGVILAHHPDPKAWVGKSAKATELFRRVVLQGVTQGPGPNDKPLIYAFAELPSARGAEPVSVIVGIPEDGVFAAANRTVWRNLGFLLLALGASLFIGWLGSARFLLRPLRSLGDTAARLAAGDLNVRTHEPYGTKEVHRLASAFDTMAVSLQQAEAERSRGEDALKEEAGIASALAGASKELISTIDTAVLLERLCQCAAQVLGVSFSQTYLRQGADGPFWPAAGVPTVNSEEQRFLGVDYAEVSALEREDVVIVNVAGAESPGFRSVFAGSDATILCMALRRGPELVGFQSAGPWSDENPLRRAHLRIGEGLSQVASLALANASLLEEVEAASRVKTDFLATMSHELRTPCHIIVGYLQLVMEGSLDPLTPRQIRALRKVHDNVRGLLELINTTLDLSRLEAGRASVSIEKVSLCDLLEEIESEAEPLLREKPSVEFVCCTGPAVPSLYTDRGKLKVTLKNLVNNAIKFTDQGRIEIDVKSDGGSVAIVVRDSGVGIAPELIPVIFEMFRQGDSSLNRKYGGTGLGLHIVKRMVELLGGSVSVESQVGRGSTFTVRLPIDSRGAVEGQTSNVEGQRSRRLVSHG